jgi:tetratricopeptide (TPR) repeat protein
MDLRRCWSAAAVVAALARSPGTAQSSPSNGVVAGSGQVAPPRSGSVAADGADAEAIAALPRFGTAREQLAFAERQRAGLREVPGARLAAERRRVALCYAAVRVHFLGARATAAEASFRAAEHWRCIGESARALAELEQARRLGEGNEISARAGLEIGHIERRRRLWSRALDRYLEVASDANASARWRDEAALWAGKTYASMGELDDARRRFVHLAATSLDPLTRIRAYDEWALTFLVHDDVEAAMGALARCREALAEPARELTELGDRVRRALSRMRCITAIEHAISKRHG